MHRRQNKRERGYVLITMALTAVAVFAATGLAVDLGRMFIAKNETQAYSDSAALAAALALDGTSVGITNATTAVANSHNAWNMDTSQITNYTVDFSNSVSGPWSSLPANPSGYNYARVRATVTMPLFFLPVVAAGGSQNVTSASIAAQIPQTTVTRGLGPYTAVAPNPTAPNFGLTVGNQYDIQWPAYNGTRAGCSPSTPDGCFVSPPCSGDPTLSKSEVVQYWGASINGYWGSNSNNAIDQEVLDNVQLQPVAIGSDITLSSGNKNAEASALDTRVNEDGDVIDNTLASYLANVDHNGRRILQIPVVTPGANGTVVDGYGAFMLISNGSAISASNYYTALNGNQPYCAIYLGPFVQGSMGGGATSSSSGSFKVALVQ